MEAMDCDDMSITQRWKAGPGPICHCAIGADSLDFDTSEGLHEQTQISEICDDLPFYRFEAQLTHYNPGKSGQYFKRFFQNDNRSLKQMSPPEGWGTLRTVSPILQKLNVRIGEFVVCPCDFKNWHVLIHYSGVTVGGRSYLSAARMAIHINYHFGNRLKELPRCFDIHAIRSGWAVMNLENPPMPLQHSQSPTPAAL